MISKSDSDLTITCISEASLYLNKLPPKKCFPIWLNPYESCIHILNIKDRVIALKGY